MVLLGARGDDARRWRAALDLFQGADVYFGPDYARAYEDLGWGRACGFLYRSDGGAVLHPLLVREIADLPWARGVAADARDCVTPYGYAGPLCSVPAAPEPSGDGPRRTALVAEFDRAFRAACRQAGIVSEFVRFHPLLGTREYFAPSGGEEPTRRGETVWLDLREATEERLMAGMLPAARNKVRRAVRAGVTIESGSSAEALETLHRLYEATIRRLVAPPEYRFPLSYFHAMARLPGSRVVVARRDGRAVWAGIFLSGGRFLHYHLSGSAEGEAAPGANNLALLQAAVEGARAGAEAFHLGGGFGARSDSLLAFKAAMGPGRAEYWTAERIHDPDRYARLCEARSRAASRREPREPAGSRESAGSVESNGYFPAYRAAV